MGVLQFDVVVARLASEYWVAAALEPLPHTAPRRAAGPAPLVARLQLSPATALRAVDRADRSVLIHTSDAAVRIAERDNPSVTFAPLGVP